jgi:fumarate reductase subunit D
MSRTRNHPAYWAFLVHRISGLALGTALEGEEAMGGFLRWTEQPLVVGAEWVLVTLLAAHLAGGVRLLALEFLPWREWHKTLAALAAFVALAAGLVFALAR